MISNSKTQKQYIFVLNDNENYKYDITEQIKEAYNRKDFTNNPVVAIDGIIFKYDKRKDTIILPLKKSEITNFTLLGKNISSVIYGKKETNGAIVINTTNL